MIGVQAGFPGAVAGLAPGDVITRIDQQPLTSLDVLKGIYQSFETKPTSLLLLTTRNRRVSLYVLKP